ncbi:MAG TPA: tetratricopeptide repeat protein [Gemmatimonadaceae bacterium]|nr:tetratricopeptide repeat protein [Gemmatimonadaceae bacterium]
MLSLLPRPLLAAFITISGCTSSSVVPRETPGTVSHQRRAEAVSLLGDTLRTFPLAPETVTRYERQLAEARSAYERTPTNADSIVWLGRRLAYLGRIREAIDVYTRGLSIHPQNPWLYRHRGHRYITVREFDRALADLERAASLVVGKPDEVEPDGQPNALNQPIGTLHSNIDYHLALTHYLKGDFERALPIYRRELDNARNDDRRVSITYWYYLSLRRLSRADAAAAVLAPVSRGMTVIENDTYLRLLSLYKGELPADSVLVPEAGGGVMSVTYATAAYGTAMWHLLNGRNAEAEQIFRRIVAGGQWGAFGYVAAEAELARRRTVRSSVDYERFIGSPRAISIRSASRAAPQDSSTTRLHRHRSPVP